MRDERQKQSGKMARMGSGSEWWLQDEDVIGAVAGSGSHNSALGKIVEIIGIVYRKNRKRRVRERSLHSIYISYSKNIW